MSDAVTRLVEDWAQNPMALRLGSALLHFLWQGAGLAAVAWLGLAVLKRARPQARYAFLVVLFAALAIAPVATLLVIDDRPAPGRGPQTQTAHPVDSIPLTIGDQSPLALDKNDGLTDGAAQRFDPPREPAAANLDRQTPEFVPSEAWSERMARVDDWLARHRQIFVALWLAGVSVLSLRLAAGLIGAERARRLGVTSAAESIERLVASLSARMGVRQTVHVFESALAEVPTLVGWLRPVILLPASALCGLTPAQLEAILAHELAHVRRHDYLINLMQTVVETILFYHPAVWWLSSRIRQEREHCCDDVAVSVCADRVSYARALAQLEELRLSPPRWVVAAHGGVLATRIRRLLGRPEAAGSGKPALAVVAAILLLAAAISYHPLRTAQSDEALAELSKSGESESPEPESDETTATKNDPAKSNTPWSVFGKVTDGEGKPLAGVVVEALTGHPSLRVTGKAETGADGTYRLAFEPRMAKNDAPLQAATIMAYKSGFFEKNLNRQGDLAAASTLPEADPILGDKKKADVILPGKPREIDFVMLKAARVAGTLIDKDEQPLAGYPISLTGEDLPPLSPAAQSTSDENGHFVLTDIPTGFKFQFLVEPAKRLVEAGRQPSWNAWASGPHEFGRGSRDDLFELRDVTESFVNHFELQVIGVGGDVRQALSSSRETLEETGDPSTASSPRHEASLRLTLFTPTNNHAEKSNPPTAEKPEAPESEKNNTDASQPRHKVAIYQFQVTNRGKPVAGAVVTGRHTAMRFGFQTDEMTSAPATTDAEGMCRVAVPQNEGTLQSYQGIGEARPPLWLRVDHPQFPVWSKWINSSTTTRVVLSNPATVVIRVQSEGSKGPASGLYPVLNRSFEVGADWSEKEGVLTLRRLDLSSDQASRWLRVVRVGKDRQSEFSNLIDLTQLDEDLQATVTLWPGVRVAGHLDRAVPRPVKNGRALAVINSGTDPLSNWRWMATADVQPDGTFEFSSLPANENLQVIVVCDGWISQSPAPEATEDYARRYGFADPAYRGPLPTYVHPQLRRLQGPEVAPVIPMQAACTAEVTVVDDDGQPIPDALVRFGPTQAWFHGGSNTLGVGFDMLAAIRAQLAGGRHEKFTFPVPGVSDYAVKTNARGMAVVRNLPSSGPDQHTVTRDFVFTVTHDGFVPTAPNFFGGGYVSNPPATASILPGQTGRVLVRMKRK